MFQRRPVELFCGGRRSLHLLEGGNLGLQLRGDGLDFFRLVQLDLLEMFHRGLLLRLGPAVLRIG